MLERLKRSEVARNVMTLGAGNFVGQVITVAGLPILSRVYGPAAYGLLAIYVSISMLVSVAGTGRYEFAIVLPTSERSALAVRMLAHRLLCTVSTLSFLVLLVFLDPIAEMLNAVPFKFWLLTIPLNVLLMGELSILNLWHTRAKSFRAQGLARILLSVGTVGFQLVLGLWVFPDIRGLVLGLMIAQLGSCLYLELSDVAAKRKVRGVQRTRLFVILRRYRKMPLLNAPTALLDSVRTNGVNLLVGSQSMSALGQYSMAWRSVQVPLGLIGAALSQVFFQKMSSDGRGALFTTVWNSVVRSLLVSLPIFIPIFVFAPQLLPLFLGHEWEDAGLYAQALTPWLYLNLATAPIATVFVVAEAQGRQAMFGLLYTFCALMPLLIIRENLLMAVWVMSMAMSACLLGFIFLALLTAREYDSQHPLLRSSAVDGERR